ncbi:hypothetical protein [Nostoc sp. 106C]|uniref:hypothetical protein n=1 Tax=Nostoc sp. 106C TaxID=1932667 RepID=UPI001AA12F27|nr:hypothetical protein [Nostoc sp. 106C]
MKTKFQTRQRKIKGFEDFLSRTQVNLIYFIYYAIAVGVRRRAIFLIGMLLFAVA